MLWLRVLLFTVVVPGAVAGYIPLWLVGREPESARLALGALRYAGVLPLLAGLAIYAWCAWDFAVAGRGTPAPFDAPRALVVRGLYRYMRNPMYVGVLAVILGQALLHASPSLLRYTGGVFVMFHLVVLLYEEPVLGRRFGDSYARYRATVPRWLPRLRAPQPAR